MKKIDFKKPVLPVVTKALVRRNTAAVEETLQHRWLRIGGPRPKPAYTRSFSQTKEDPMVRNEKLNGKTSVGLRVQTRLDEGILVAEVGTGDYLREEFLAHQEVPKLKAELASQLIEGKFREGCLKEVKEVLVEKEVEIVKKDMILKKSVADREKQRRKNEKLKERKMELKKLMADIRVVTENENRAAAQKIREIERENRALRLKMSLMKSDHEEMKPVVDYDTDGYKSADEIEMDDEKSSEEEVVETESDDSDASESWDLFLERKTE